MDEMNCRYRTKLLSLTQRFETLHRFHLTFPIVFLILILFCRKYKLPNGWLLV